MAEMHGGVSDNYDYDGNPRVNVSVDTRGGGETVKDGPVEVTIDAGDVSSLPAGVIKETREHGKSLVSAGCTSSVVVGVVEGGNVNVGKVGRGASNAPCPW